MSNITAQEIIDSLNHAWTEFGKHAYFDKGADEVMQIDEINVKLRNLPPREIMGILKEVAQVKDSERLVSSLLQSFDDDDDLWEKLESIDEDFLNNHY